MCKQFFLLFLLNILWNFPCILSVHDISLGQFVDSTLDLTLADHYNTGLSVALKEGNSSLLPLGIQLNVISIGADKIVPSNVIAVAGTVSTDFAFTLNSTGTPTIGYLYPSFTSEISKYSTLFQIRGSVEDELAGLVDYATRIAKRYDIGIFTSDRAWDLQCYSTLQSILDTVRIGPVGIGKYNYASTNGGSQPGNYTAAFQNFTTSSMPPQVLSTIIVIN